MKSTKNLTHLTPKVDNPSNSTEGVLTMIGSIGARGNCPTCKGTFSEKDNFGLKCPKCLTRPTRYYIQAKYFGLGYLYSTPQGQVLSSYDIADALLSAIRTEWDESVRARKLFNTDKWIPAKVAQKKMGEVIKSFLKEKDREYRRQKLSKSHWQQLHNHSKKFILPFFKSEFLDAIQEQDIREFYDYLQDLQYVKNKKGERDYYSTKHIKDIMMTLRSLFNFARLDIPPYPKGWDAVEPKRLKQYLTLELQMKIDPHIPDRHGYRLAIAILQTTGMRICELRGLVVADVIDRGVIVWKSLTDRLKKNRKGYAKEQFYPLPKYIMDDLREQVKGKAPDEFIFTVNGSPYKLGTLRDMWYNVLDKLGIPRIELNQGGRHTWASREMETARDEALDRIQKQLGHSNKKTSQEHYIIER